MSDNKPITGAYARVCCVRKCPVCGADCALVANTQRAQFECVTGIHFFENNHGAIGNQKECSERNRQKNKNDLGRRMGGSRMNLNIREIDPESRGLLYRLQAEQNLPNLAETIKFLIKNYYKIDK